MRGAGGSLGGMRLSSSAALIAPAALSEAEPVRVPVPGRACGDCTLCCHVVAVAELDKPPGIRCPHAQRCNGCAIYPSRPAACRDFYCEWMLSTTLGREWKPDRARFALMVTVTGHLSACVHPDFPSAWRRPAYYPTLRRWARERAADPWSPWPGVDVWIGNRCIILLPDGETDLGVVSPEEEVRIDLEPGPSGPAYVARKFRAR